MPYTEEGKAVMLHALASYISHASLHGGPPPGRELAGGVYRRKQIDFRNPDDGSMRTSLEVAFDVPEGVRVTHVGFWTSIIGGDLLAWGRTTEHSFRGRGIYIIDLAKLDLNAGPDE